MLHTREAYIYDQRCIYSYIYLYIYRYINTCSVNAVRAYGHDLCIQAHTPGFSTDSQEQLWIPTLHPDSKEVDPQHEIWMCHWPVEHLHQTHQEWNMFFFLLHRCTDTQTWAIGPQSAHPRSWEFLRASLSRN